MKLKKLNRGLAVAMSVFMFCNSVGNPGIAKVNAAQVEEATTEEATTEEATTEEATTEEATTEEATTEEATTEEESTTEEATTEEVTTEEEATTEEEVVDPTRGQCGENVFWKVEDTTLVIYGEGAMTSLDIEREVITPVTKVVIEDGVTSICEEAFLFIGETWGSYYSNIEEIIIPESVTYIGGGAFCGLRNLKTINLPSKLEVINESTFYYSGLESIEIPANVKMICDSAFYECNYLVNVVMHEGLNWIGRAAFSCDCEFKNNRLRKIVIPDTVTYIGDDAFANDWNLEEVKLPKSLVYLGIGAFQYCGGLQHVDIPNGLKRIESSTFSSCGALRTVKLPDELEYIGDRAFEYTHRLEEINIPNKVEVIDTSAFNGSGLDPQFYANGMKKIVIPYNVKALGPHSFSNSRCYEMEIWNPDIDLGKDFMYYSSIKTIKVPCCMSEEQINNVILGDTYRYGYSSYNESYKVEVEASLHMEGADGKCVWCHKVITSGKDDISSENSDYELSLSQNAGECLTITGTGDIDSIPIPDDIKNTIKKVEIVGDFSAIGYKAFAYFSSLTEVTIDDKDLVIEDDAFKHCDKLKTFYIRCDSSDLLIESLEKLNVTVVKSIHDFDDNGICNNCQKDDSILEKGQLDNISWILYKDGKLVITGEGAINNLLSIKNVNRVKEVFICDGITSIYPSMFGNYTNIESVSFADTIKSIGISSFEGCESLKEVIIPNGIDKIENRVFYGCESLTNVVIPGTVKVIEQYAFYRCRALSEIDLPSSVISIGHYAFSECGLKYLAIPDTVTTLGHYAFFGCKSLEEVKLSKGIKKFNFTMFLGCNLKTVVIPEGVEELYGAYETENLTEISLPMSLKICEGNIASKKVYIHNPSIEYHFRPLYVEEIHIPCDTSEEDYQSIVDGIAYHPIHREEDVPVIKDVHNFVTNGICDICNVIPLEIGGVSLNLADKIGIIFYVAMDERFATSPNAKMVFTFSNGNVIKKSIPKKTIVNGKEYYKISCEVAAAEMTMMVEGHVQLQDGTVSESLTYSVKKYTDKVLKRLRYDEQSADLVSLIDALLRYGTCAQIYFGYDNYELADKYAPSYYLLNSKGPYNDEDFIRFFLKDYKPNTYEYSDVNIKGANLSLKSETDLKIFFNINKGTINDYEFSLDGKKVKPTYYSKNVYYVCVKNIAPSKLADMHQIKVNDMTFEYSAMNYMYNVVNSTNADDNLKKLVRALYFYQKEACNYYNNR